MSGIDCSGKSTQIQLLKSAMEQAGIRVTTAWYRPGYSKGLNRLRSLIRKIRPAALPQSTKHGQGCPATQAQRDLLFQKPGVARLWVTMALLDSIWQYGIRARWILGVTGRTIIFDRHVADGLLDLSLRFPRINIDRHPLTRALEKVAVGPRESFLLMIPREEMKGRMKIKNEPFPDPEEIRDKRYQAYAVMGAEGKWTVIDGDRTREEIHREVAGKLNIPPLGAAPKGAGGSNRS